MKITRFSNLSEARYPVPSLTKEQTHRHNEQTISLGLKFFLKKKKLKFNIIGQPVKKVI